MSFNVLFHLKMNMIELLLTNHYDFTKSKILINRFHLKTHVEFWNQKKIRFDNWDFHVAQKLILQSYKTRMTTIFWIFQRQKIHENVDESTDELERLKNWINDVIASSLFQLVEKIRIYLMSFHLFNIQNEKLRNYILYVQQVETYLLLKYVISRDDIDLFFRMCAWIIWLFHESKKFNYQMKTLYMFWLTNTNACIDDLKKAILVNSLMNIQRKKNKFFFVDLHLKLLNEYVKKIMKNRRISFMNLEYLFEYNAKFASSIKQQFIWMKRFHNVRVNIKHSIINEFNDIMKLTIESRKEMIYREIKRIFSTNQTKNLFVLDDKTLKVFVDKFNAKWSKSIIRTRSTKNCIVIWRTFMQMMLLICMQKSMKSNSCLRNERKWTRK
jgi:hypothetical protein